MANDKDKPKLKLVNGGGPGEPPIDPPDDDELDEQSGPAGLPRLSDPAPELPDDRKPKAPTKPKRVRQNSPIRANRREHTKKVLLECLKASLGVVTTACQMAGIGRTQFYEIYNEDEAFRTAAAECNELALDFAESKLHERIMRGDTTATIFFLKTKGKRRGYVERIENTGPDGRELPPPSTQTTVIVVLPDNGRQDSTIDVTPADKLAPALKLA